MRKEDLVRLIRTEAATVFTASNIPPAPTAPIHRPAPTFTPIARHNPFVSQSSSHSAATVSAAAAPALRAPSAPTFVPPPSAPRALASHSGATPTIAPFSSSVAVAVGSASHQSVSAAAFRTEAKTLVPFAAVTNAVNAPVLLEALLAHPSWRSLRSPFFLVERDLAPPALFQVSNGPNRKAMCAVPVTLEMREKVKRVPTSYAVHLRLFGENVADPKHVHWDNTGRFQLYINKMFRNPVTKVIKRSGIRKQGLELCPPLDITMFLMEQGPANQSIIVDVEVLTNGQPFVGLLAVEFVHVQTTADICARIAQSSATAHIPIPAPASATPMAPRASALPAPLPVAASASSLVRQCNICHSTSPGLLRCSRCKSVWYCNAAHQSSDWPQHRQVCTPHNAEPAAPCIAAPAPAPAPAPVPPPRVKEEKQDAELLDDDEIEELDVWMSLVCPLSIRRLRIPARGKNCKHAQCLDLETFLDYCHQNSIWQCTICHKALDPASLIVDSQLQSLLLEQRPEDVSKVRVDKGIYHPVTDAEFRAWEAAKRSSQKRVAAPIRIDDDDTPVAKVAKPNSATTEPVVAESARAPSTSSAVAPTTTHATSAAAPAPVPPVARLVRDSATASTGVRYRPVPAPTPPPVDIVNGATGAPDDPIVFD
jgi:hypothetical protein